MTGLEKLELKPLCLLLRRTTAGATVELCSAKGEASKSAIEEALTKGCKAQGSTVGKGSYVQLQPSGGGLLMINPIVRAKDLRKWPFSRACCL